MVLYSKLVFVFVIFFKVKSKASRVKIILKKTPDHVKFWNISNKWNFKK